MFENSQLNQKDQLAILGSLIKINRIKQNMSQQALCEGVCVPSYLSKIENGEIVPSLGLISDLFENLGILYRDEQEFIEDKQQQIEQFYEELNFSGFGKSEQIYKSLSLEEEDLIHSPLIIDYYLMKFAYYCATLHRKQFESAQTILKLVLNRLTPKQRHRYYFYHGIDELFINSNFDIAKSYFISSNQYNISGNSLHFLGLTAYMQGSYFEAIERLQQAQQRYIEEGNPVAMVHSFECLGLLSYKIGSLERALNLLQKASNYAKKLNRTDLMTMPLCAMGYLYLKSEAFEQAHVCIQKAREIKQQIQLPWSDLEIIEFLHAEIIAKLNGASTMEYELNQCLNLEEKTKVGIQLLQTCYRIKNTQTEIESLYQAYKQLPGIKLYLDEMVKDAMLSYYIQARKYKEACLLKEPTSN
ncbi:MAG TPA: hypothetical protein DCY20_00615 [Firmicutes bacterium]|nr:hypothetical protein [Bacillota bacterium]